MLYIAVEVMGNVKIRVVNSL